MNHGLMKLARKTRHAGSGLLMNAGAQTGFRAVATVLLAGLASPVGAQTEYLSSNIPAPIPPPRTRTTIDQPYTLRKGDFRLLVKPSFSIEWNDNINTSSSGAEDDFILRPMLDLVASHPLGQNNLLRLDVGIGYDLYLDHDDLSTWRLDTGSSVSFDIAIRDVTVNLHDRFTYVRDSARQGDVAGTADQGNFQNNAGLGISWPLGKAYVSAGFDHQNSWSIADQNAYQDRATEIVSTRNGIQLHPQLTVGIEGSVSLTSYDQPVLNDSAGYNAGVFAEWQLGTAILVQPRAGYSFFDFEQSSAVTPAEDADSWYADLTLRHQVRDAISYSLSIGQELRLGLQSDAVTAWYVRPSMQWQITERITVSPSFFYENGSQGATPFATVDGEDYEWYGANLAVSGSLTRKIRLSLGYRFTLRDSSLPNRDYTQNMVTLQCSYLMQ